MSEERFYDVAVVGMAGRFAGAGDLAAFWDNLRRGVDCLSTFTDGELEAEGVPRELRELPRYVRRRGVLRDAERFDAALFDVNPREARLLDPQQRVFLETAWEALEDAGCDPARAEGTVGVYAGTSQSTWFLSRLLDNPEVARTAGPLEVRLGNDKDFLSTQASYRLNLRGPSVNVSTACSTSLVAVHLACQGLLNRECDLALAGGVSITFPQRAGYVFQEGGILSADGLCRAFDAAASGTVGGDGVGLVALKRLEDALRDGDRVRAVIRGSAINNDGATKIGYTAPSVEGQAAVIAEAQSMAGVEPGSVTYVETHGSGTPLGDLVEIRALTRAFRAGTDRMSFCAVGSVKTNVGHCDSAAGIAGLIKTVLALENRLIPPSLHVEKPHPEIGFEETPFFVAAKAIGWNPADGQPRRAGVSSFGIGGTNAHVVLEEAPEPEPSESTRPHRLLVLSAATPAALDEATGRLAGHLKAHPEIDLADAAWTLQTGRRALRHRRALVCKDTREAVEALAGRDRLLDGEAIAGRPVAFLFPGLGDHYPGMAQGLYETEPVFREVIDRGTAILGRGPHPPAPSPGEGGRGGGRGDGGEGPDLRRMLGRSAQPSSTAQDQPAVFLVEMALARLWESWGIRPSAALGYSLGEYSAACLAGVFSFEDGLRLVAERARLLDALPPGAMLAVPLSEDRLELSDSLAVAAVNAPDLCVVAGPVEAVDAFAQRLTSEGVACRRLPTSHAFHSPCMAPAADGLRRLLATVGLKPPAIPWVSNVTGTWITEADATDPESWVRHLLGTVRFAEGLRTLCQEPAPVLLEVGPGHGLSTLALQQSAGRVAIPTLRPVYDPKPDDEFLAAALARLWLSGAEIDWHGVHAGEKLRKTALPTYPFQRQRYAFDPPHRARVEEPVPPVRERASPPSGTEPQTGVEEGIAAIWRDILQIERVGRHDSFFELGGHSLLAPRVLDRLGQTFGVDLPLARLLEAPTVAQIARAVETLRQGGSIGGVDDETPDLEADVQLDPSIRPESTELGDLSDPRAVVLTGATGFLGAFLLRELLVRTRATVHCLVRAGSAGEARERLLDNLSALRLGDLPADRIVAVPGDLAEPRWGLDERDFRSLAETAEAVHHCGAWVNFTYPYRTLKAANVGGTVEALRLAALGRAKPLHFVSTLAVFAAGSFTGEGVGLEDSPLRDSRSLGGGYPQSKWVAEKILGLARERGLRSAVYRPGLVSGDSRTGVGNLRDLMWAFLKGCVQMGAAPDLAFPFDPVPADWLGRAVVHLSRQRASLDRAFHFFHPAPIPWREVFRFARTRGWPLELLPAAEWDRRLAETLEGNALAPFRPLLRDGLLAADLQETGTPFRFDARNVRLAGIEPPPALDGELLARTFSWFVECGFLPAPAEEILR